MTAATISMPDWLAFLQSQAVNVTDREIEVTLAGHRAVLNHALRVSGRAAEADRLGAIGDALALPDIGISTFAQAGEALAAIRAAHGPRQDLSLIEMLAAEIGEAAILLENEGDPVTSSAGGAVVARAERMLDMINVRLELLLAKVEPFSGRFQEMDSERGRFLLLLAEGWRQDRDRLQQMRVAGSTLTHSRLEALRSSEPIVARLYGQGALNDMGQLALLRQIERLVEEHDRPAFGGGSVAEPVFAKRTSAGLNNASTQLNLVVGKLRKLAATPDEDASTHAPGLTEGLLTILDGAQTRAEQALSMLAPTLDRYDNPDSERAVFFAGLLREWTADVEALKTCRADLAALPFGEAYLTRASETAALLAGINRNGLISEEGVHLRLRQANSLLEHQNQPLVLGRADTRKPIEFDAIVDFWSPQAADKAKGAGRYLKDIGQDRPTFLMDPPGRGKRPPEIYDPAGLARDIRWLVRAGHDDEAKALVGSTMRKLRVADRSHLAWLAAVAALKDTLTTAELALEDLVVANKSAGSMDRYIDRLGLIISRCDDAKLASTLIDRGAEKGDRACAAAMLLAVKGRSNKRVTLAGGSDSHRGDVFFRLARAHVGDSTPSTPTDILVTDASTGRWLAALPGLADHPATVLNWDRAEAGRGSAIYKVAALAVASIAASMDACAVPLAPTMRGADLARSLREPLQAFDQAFRAARASKASPLIGLGIDRLDDVLALPFCKSADPSFFGVGASPSRVARLRLALAGREPTTPVLSRSRQEHVTSSYEYFLAGLGGGPHRQGAAPWTSHLDFDGRWASHIAEIAAHEAVSNMPVGPRRAALRSALANLIVRTLIGGQMSWLLASETGEGLRAVA